jgi:peptidoglycan-associated lipoprotein
LNAERAATPIRRFVSLALVIGVVGIAAVGCAKRPALVAASAPPPTGVAALAPAPVVPAPEPKPMTEQPSAAPQPTPAPVPMAAPPAPKEFAAVPELKEIHFDFDRYDIRPGDAQILRSNAQWLKDHGDQLVLIEGHCDERGTNEYNMALGERRAKATMNFLVGQGVKADRVSIISYGEERPVCTEHNEACWSKNRRARTLVKPQ